MKWQKDVKEKRQISFRLKNTPGYSQKQKEKIEKYLTKCSCNFQTKHPTRGINPKPLTYTIIKNRIENCNIIGHC